MADLEKVSINLGPVDLGQIDLLVDQGYYTNRTDLIRIAIRNQLDSHAADLKQFREEYYYVMGIMDFDRERLEDVLRNGAKLSIKVIGGLIVSKDVSLELAQAAFGKVKIYGIIRAPENIKKFLRQLHEEGKA
ncbi:MULTISPECIES: CopG family transcriptional regulator [Paenibacillus]|uniref:Arc/MetJ-type ribon-helix-helix transcriptional regulator n=2 Tax=Paenibacillus TaxID=44249 RepID=A0AAP5LNE1_PAEAM|nr:MULTISPECIES: CopG family transcriptional regulator [Paenibacillus]MCG7377805.1 CopG family transcriptional regulator [Paenibacillus sp. ACRSA]MCM3176095.1 CopG family transcriptional regulator [Paenibacillus sp. MER 99-2]MDQ0171840.1 Arc/MetJ-type ribon-helix-helix transcriptional regulator [Paenibacillus tundrae]MDR6725647.1 Arc/MetJ-type ribon-helix-helix transcriptional regulator [Paenibacillus amylolyticus]